MKTPSPIIRKQVNDISLLFVELDSPLRNLKLDQPVIPMKTHKPVHSLLLAFTAAVGFTSLFAPQAIGQDTFYWITDNTATQSLSQAANWSLDESGNPVATSAPSAADSLIFNRDSLNLNLTVNMAAGNRSYNSMTFRNTGTTQVDRNSTASPGSQVLNIGAGGILVQSGAGAVTFGDGTQEVRVRASADLNITNDSSGLLVFGSRVDSGAASGTTTITLNGSGSGGTTFQGIIRNGANANVALAIDTTGGGITTLEGTNTYSGGTTLQGGILGLRNSSALGSGALTINGGTLASVISPRTLTNNVTVGGDFSLGGQGSAITLNGTMNFGGATRTINLENSAAVGGVISNGGLNLTGDVSRSLTLDAANTYTGDTTVSSGTLIISSTGSLAATNITVDAGAVMEVAAGGSIANSPSIFINGALENASMLTIGSGNSIGGNGTVSGSLDFVDGANFQFDLNSTLTVNGTDVTFGGFSIANLIGIDFSSVALNTPYTLIDGTANINFTNVGDLGFENRVGVWGGREAFFQSDSLQLELVVIPEHSTFALFGGFVALVALIKRRRKMV